jgi:predicted RNA-binding protein YlxR (DUF448 family)
MTAGINTRSTKKRKGPRPKHVPQRTCIVCRERSAKRALARIVRTPEGSVLVDATGKLNGRGAYLCDDSKCWERALSSNILAYALKIDIDDEATERLRRHAATLPQRQDTASEATREG